MKKTKVYGVVNYSPLDVDSMLAQYARTMKAEEKADILYSFSQPPKGFKSRIAVIFNSLDYCERRKDIVILDTKGKSIIEVVEAIKSAI